MSRTSQAGHVERIIVRPRYAGLAEIGELTSPTAGEDGRRFHASMPGYAPTPLRDAPTVACRLGVAEVLVKDESSRLGLPSFKVLGASWAVYRALRTRLRSESAVPRTFGELKGAVDALRPLTLTAATDGNHGRAVARMAALLGLQSRIYVPAGTAAARIDVIAAEGATVTVVDGGYDDAVRRSAEDASESCLVISDTSWEGYEEVPRWVIEGYATIFAEIDEWLANRQHQAPSVIAVPMGVGALAGAAVRHYRSQRAADDPGSAPPPQPLLVGVEPSSAACVLESVAAGAIVTLDHAQDSIMAGLNCATPSLVAWPLVSRGFDAYIAVDDVRVPEAMQLLAKDGVTAGETGAAGLAGLLRVVDGEDAALRSWLLPAGAHVLLLCTEGATDPDAYRRIIEEA